MKSNEFDRGTGLLAAIILAVIIACSVGVQFLKCQWHNYWTGQNISTWHYWMGKR